MLRASFELRVGIRDRYLALALGVQQHRDTDTASLWPAPRDTCTSPPIAVTNAFVILHEQFAIVVSVSEFVIEERSLHCEFIVFVIVTLFFDFSRYPASYLSRAFPQLHYICVRIPFHSNEPM